MICTPQRDMPIHLTIRRESERTRLSKLRILEPNERRVIQIHGSARGNSLQGFHDLNLRILKRRDRDTCHRAQLGIREHCQLQVRIRLVDDHVTVLGTLRLPLAALVHSRVHSVPFGLLPVPLILRDPDLHVCFVKIHRDTILDSLFHTPVIFAAFL